MATKPRGWTGARTPSALKRVRTAERRAEINQPRRSAAKTLTTKAVRVAAGTTEGDPETALREALSSLDRAAKAGALHPNAVARRKSRLTRKVNAALGGAHVQTGAKVTKTHRQGRRGQGRQEAHRPRQGGQGQGRPDGRRQGPRRPQQDRSGGSRQHGRRKGGRRSCRQDDDHEGRRQAEGDRDEDRRPQGDGEGPAAKPKATAKPTATAKAPAKKPAAK